MNLIHTGQACIGVRPEHLLPELAFSSGEAVLPFPLDVQRVEDLGADRLIYATLGPPHPPTRVISRLPSMVPVEVKPGERHAFVVRPHDVRRFAPDTGRSLGASA